MHQQTVPRDADLLIDTFRLKNLFRYLFLIFGCLHLIGGPNSLIQVYAWANMVVSYSQEASLPKAVTDTFSGEKPCSLCKRIAAVKASESKSEKENSPLASLTSKFFHDLFLSSIARLENPVSTPLSEIVFPAVADSISPLPSGPIVPPPRC